MLMEKIFQNKGILCVPLGCTLMFVINTSNVSHMNNLVCLCSSGACPMGVCKIVTMN